MLVGLFLLQHLFALEAYQDLIKAVMEAAAAFVGIAIKQRKEPITFEQFQQHRMGKYR
jgi:DnaJ family protein C protein 13